MTEAQYSGYLIIELRQSSPSLLPYEVAIKFKVGSRVPEVPEVKSEPDPLEEELKARSDLDYKTTLDYKITGE